LERGRNSMSIKVVAYVLVVTEVGTEHKVVEELENIEGVTFAQTVYGEFDVLCKVERDNLKNLDEAITKIRKIKSIIRTMTLISG
jgi:DNA-binding Lrp family transcriptional regulator